MQAQEHDILAFYRRAYRPDHPLASEKFFRWWLRDNPYNSGQGATAKLAIDGDTIAGHYGYIPARLWIRGAVRPVFWAGNLVVDERYRRQGIGGRLVAALRDAGEIGLDLGASPIAEPMLVKDGWTHMGTLHRWVGILDASRAEEIAADPSIVGACALFEVELQTGQGCEIREILRFGIEHDVFWHKRRAAIACATDREAKYLNWRYADHPVFRYKMYEIRSWDTVEGYAIMHEEKVQGTAVPMSVMRVVEFLTMPGFEGSLFLHLVHEARRHDAVLMDFFCASADFGSVFEKYGFCREPASLQIARLFSPVVLSKWPISFNAVFTRNTGEKLPLQEEWYVTTGDGDQDRPNSA